MEYLFVFATFLFGMIIGSFLNALIFRFNTGSTMWTRSKCMTCSTTIEWYDLVPGISFFLLRGKCRNCESAISFQYPLIEILNGLLFATITLLFGLTFETILLWALSSLMVLIFVYDYRHKIIPNAFVYPATLLSLMLLFVKGSIISTAFFQNSHIYTGIGLFFFFFLFWFFSKGTWMGLGDAKLALMMGFLLGPVGGVSATVIGFWLGAIVGLALIFIERIKSKSSLIGMKSEIPFAPFLLIGTWIVLFFNISVF